MFLVRQYGEMIVQFLVKSTKFGTVIVFGELINFRYRPIRNSFKGGPLLIQGGGVGIILAIFYCILYTRSPKFGTVTVLDELIKFRYRPNRIFSGGTTFEPREEGVGII